MKWVNMKLLADGYVHRKDLPWASLQSMAWARVGRSIDVTDNEIILPGNVAAFPALPGTYAFTQPDDFGRVKAFKQGDVQLMAQDIQAFEAKNWQGAFFCVTGTSILTRTATAAVLTYGAIPADMAADDDETVMAKRYPDAMIKALLVEGATFMQDFEQVEVYTKQFNQAIDEANSNSAWQRQTPGRAPNIMGGP